MKRSVWLHHVRAHVVIAWYRDCLGSCPMSAGYSVASAEDVVRDAAGQPFDDDLDDALEEAGFWPVGAFDIAAWIAARLDERRPSPSGM